MTSSDYREFQQIWQPRIAAEIYAYTGDRAAAAEIAQEVFSLAGSRWTRLERQEDPIRWARQEAWQRIDERWLGTARPSGDEFGPAMVAALAMLDPATRRTVVLLLADVPSHEYVALGATTIPAAQWDEALEHLATALPGQDPAALFAQLCTGWEITVPRSRADSAKPSHSRADPAKPRRARSHSLAPSRSPRRTRSLVAAGAAAVLVAAIVVVMRWPAEPAGGTAAPEVSASAAADIPWPDPSATEDPVPTPSGTTATPSPGPSASRARPTPTPTRPGASPRPGNPPATRPAVSPSPSPSPPCQVMVSVGAVVPDANGVVEFQARQTEGQLEFCGTRRLVWWASYTLDAEAGVLRLAHSGSQYLDKDRLTWSATIAVEDCAGAWYYGRGEVEIPATIEDSARDAAFAGSRLGTNGSGSACF
ncbi:hypothetical protein [Catellatospora sichuanensis]|uniref:hypothetical protein n=1 Tax=Catellatospora sichuanensis TaxID=1969805 RepID=UPI00118345DC|nr:hypothetical protein [Catellatospora sichuanensis]